MYLLMHSLEFGHEMVFYLQDRAEILRDQSKPFLWVIHRNKMRLNLNMESSMSGSREITVTKKRATEHLFCYFAQSAICVEAISCINTFSLVLVFETLQRPLSSIFK